HRVDDVVNEQIRYYRSVKRAWAYGDYVCVLDCIERIRQRFATGGRQAQSFDRRARFNYFGLAFYYATVFKLRNQSDIFHRGRKDATFDGEDFAAHFNGFEEVASHARKRRQEEIAEAMTRQFAVGLEAILKKLCQQSLIFGKRRHAVANVAG